MPSPRGESSPRDAGDTNQSRVYVAVLAIEAVVIVALYWLGRHFA
jgi:hypothetical protein